MSLKIKIPKNIEERNQVAESSSGRPVRRQSKRRQAALYSDNEDPSETTSNAQAIKPSKRARTEEAEEPVEDVDVDIVEEEVDIEDDGGDSGDDTRFLPPELRKKKQAGGSSSKTKSTARRTTISKKKRAVVWSDEEEGEGYNTAEQDATLQGDDEDFIPDAFSSKRGAISKVKLKIGKVGRGTKADRGDADIPMKDEGRTSSNASRGASADDDEFDGAKREPRGKSVSSKDPTPPPVKRPKLPPIKKNKPFGTPLAGPAAIKQAGKPAPPPPKADLTLPVPGTRKPAATANNADFDLRDASVYASLFAKPSGSTPNAGLNRKEREEERRKELNKLREEARAKRMQSLKETFDLQASQEKVQRFVEKLRDRQSAAMYPNILGGAFKEAAQADRAKMRNGHR
ncbi:hypothetical protein BDY19DRAFT_255379 [Irpex rosettiformis]|uniref:Uncharacterized protein n=1 Tax=Irpex rosettiformis TaxID=378272 RepID=A0ACB8UGV9_9APHY|nr:hypothetical protein BDY19DRAFT_255379 [Irpex rosettiformis]